MASMLSIALLAALLTPPQGFDETTRLVQRDVTRLTLAAEQSTGTWPRQPPLPVEAVALVARHGRAAVPLLVALLSDDPLVERDARRWKVQQQATLALARIYDESTHCGRIYCDGDPAERIARVKAGWLRVIAADRELQALSPRELLDRFKAEPMFWRQFEIGKALAAANHRSAIGELEAWLTHDDRHVRGNVAFVLGRLGDPRGFDTIAAILADRSPRPLPRESAAKRTLAAQIREDRYYAAHLLGDLKDPRGVPLLIALLTDPDVNAVAPWSLAAIGDPRAIRPLIEQLDGDDPSNVVYVIHALQQMHAREALPRLRALLQDSRRSSLGERLTVAAAATRAIAVIERQALP